MILRIADDLTMTPHAIHETAATAQMLLSLTAIGIGAWLARRVRRLETALDAQRKLIGQTRTPALTRVLTQLPDAGDPLPRFRLTHFDGQSAAAPTKGLQGPPPLPFV